MTLTEQIISANERLSGYKTFSRDRMTDPRKRKTVENMASEIVAQLTHIEAVACVASDWREFAPGLRLLISDRCNQQRNQSGSNNQSKMIDLLNKKLNGELLRTPDDDLIRDAAGHIHKKAVLAARQKYANRVTSHLPPQRTR